MSHVSFNLAIKPQESCLVTTPLRSVMLPNAVILLIANYCLFVKKTEGETKREAEGDLPMIDRHELPIEVVDLNFNRENNFHQMRILRGFILVKLTTETGCINDRVVELFSSFRESIKGLNPYPLHKMIEFRHTGEMIGYVARINPEGLKEVRGLPEQTPMEYAIAEDHLEAIVNLILVESDPAARRAFATECLEKYINFHSGDLTPSKLNHIKILISHGADPQKALILHKAVNAGSVLLLEFGLTCVTDPNIKDERDNTPLDQLFLKINEIEIAEKDAMCRERYNYFDEGRYCTREDERVESYKRFKAGFYVDEDILGKRVSKLTAGHEACAFILLRAGADLCLTKHVHRRGLTDAIFEKALALRPTEKSKLVFFAVEKSLVSDDCVVKLIMQCPEMDKKLLGGSRNCPLATYYPKGCPGEITEAIVTRIAMTSTEKWNRAFEQVILPPD